MIYLIVSANVVLLLLALACLYFCTKARVSATAFLLAGGCLGFILLQIVWFAEVPFADAVPLWREVSRIAVWFCFLLATLRFGRNLASMRRFTESRTVNKHT